MVDYTAERGWLSTTLKVQQLMQSAIQARWFDESEFLILPHVNNGNVHLFYNISHNYEYLTLPALKEICRNDYEKLAVPLRDMFEEPEIEQIYRVVQDLPEISVTILIQGRNYDQEEAMRPVSCDVKSNIWTEIHPNEVNKRNSMKCSRTTIKYLCFPPRTMYFASKWNE